MSDNFYTQLPGRVGFRSITEPGVFVPVPEDWTVILTDIQGSTAAVQAGNYKEVNLVGASAIIAVLNIDRTIDVPFVFGGDGATLLVPPTLVAAARQAMHATQEMAQREFGFTLRVGFVPVAIVLAAAHQILVAKLQLGPDYTQAAFAGGGLTFVEQLVKDPTTAATYAIMPTESAPKADYTGLECRWQDIPSQHGEMLSLIVAATTESSEHDSATYNDVITFVEDLYQNDDNHCPVAVEQLQPTFDLGRLALESKVRARPGFLPRLRYRWAIWGRNWLLKYFLRRDIQTGDVRWRDYMDRIVATSDYRKYDGMLRMVISSTPQQRETLTAYLEQRHEQGMLAYGLHISDRALMTCAVFERVGRQVHFIDGADGGLSSAARDLKQRLRLTTH